MVKIAKDTNRFTYLSECAPDAKIVIGDARLTLADSARRPIRHALLIDAFSSDAIPTHLLTKEAMAIYKNKIKPDGMILMHISNKHMVLGPVVAGDREGERSRLARQRFRRGLRRRQPHFRLERGCGGAPRRAISARWQRTEKWVEPEADEDQWVWTDDYSNVIGAILEKLREE